MFENFYFIFIIGFFVGIGFLSLIIFLRKDKTDIKENTDLISLKNHMQSIQQSLQNKLRTFELDREVVTLVTQVRIDENDPAIKIAYVIIHKCDKNLLSNFNIEHFILA